MSNENPISPSVWNWFSEALLALGLPDARVSLALILASALLTVGINSLLKGKAESGGLRGLPQDPDTWRWQWAWRVLPIVEGIIFGLLFSLPGSVPWGSALILGLVGGVFAVPIWHMVRGVMK